MSEIRLYPETSYARSFLSSGILSEIILTNAVNSDFVKDRSKSDEAIQISIVSESGFVIAQDSYPEAGLPNLTPADLLTATMTRESTKVGERQVIYELAF